MGMASMRGVITLVTFISVILILVGLATVETPEMFLVTPTGTGPDVRETDPSRLLAWNQTDAFVLNSTHKTQDYDVPNWHSTFWTELLGSGGDVIHVYTYDMWWVFVTNQENLGWYNETTGLKVSTVFAGVNDYMALSTFSDSHDSNFNLDYALKNTRGTLHVSVSWNTTAYGGDATAAFYGQGLVFSLKQDWSDRQTSLNLIEIVSGLFLGAIFGQNTLHIDPTISSIISIGLLSALVILSVMIVRSFIPFLGGSD